MMLNSGDPPRATLPQLHVNGKVRQPCTSSMNPCCCVPDMQTHVAPLRAQFLGDTHTIQELEDYGELEDALSGPD